MILLTLCIVGPAMPVSGVHAQEGADSASVREEIFATDMAFDHETGKISYTLPEAALVRIRIGIAEGGPLLRNLLDWEKQEAGPQEVEWDFKDATGKVYFGPNPAYFVVITCLPAEVKERVRHNVSFAGYRKAPRFQVEFPESEMQKGVPQIKPMDPIRITLDERDRQWLTETKYEVGLFIDNTFLMEEEEGLNPFTYRLDTRGLRAGKHKITVNVVGYEGEIGVHSFWINVIK